MSHLSSPACASGNRCVMSPETLTRRISSSFKANANGPHRLPINVISSTTTCFAFCVLGLSSGSSQHGSRLHGSRLPYSHTFVRLAGVCPSNVDLSTNVPLCIYMRREGGGRGGDIERGD